MKARERNRGASDALPARVPGLTADGQTTLQCRRVNRSARFIIILSRRPTMIRSILNLTCVSLFVLGSVNGQAQDDATSFLKAAAPGEPHKKLQTLVGNWDLLIKMPAGPDGKAAEVKGTIAYKSILGGRFVQEEAKTELFGQPFEWVGMYGYDNYKKKFIAVWADNFNTIIEQGEGDSDNSMKAVTLVGETIRPGGAKEKFQWVLTLPVDGKLTIEMFNVNKD